MEEFLHKQQNKLLYKKLDEVDPIESSYVLEVSSCGLERHLRSKEHFEAAIGKDIEIKFFKPFEKKKELVGVLEDVEKETIKLKTEEKTYEVFIDDISSAKIIYHWEDEDNE